MSPEDLEHRLGYRFRRPRLLQRALTHSSAKSPAQPSNERLEFLGDAVLGLVVAEHLHRTRSEPEGTLSRLRSHAVSAPALAAWADRLEVAGAIEVGRGLGRDPLPSSVLANVIEALVGAIYVDGGLESARRVILTGLARRLAARDDEHARDWKSILQEHTQQDEGRVPSYEVVSESGPDHSKEFVVRALVDGQEQGRGRGASKKAAEQEAAREALEVLREG